MSGGHPVVQKPLECGIGDSGVVKREHERMGKTVSLGDCLGAVGVSLIGMIRENWNTYEEV